MAFSLLQDRPRSAVRPDGSQRYTGPERRAPARKGFMHRATISFGPSRLFMFFLTGFVAYLGNVPGTLNARAFEDAGAYWWVVTMIALLGTVDTVVNDLMPDKYRFQSGLHLRHITIMLCAWFFAAGTYLSIVNDVLSLTPFFVVCCINLVWHTFADIWRRYHDA